MVNVRTSAFNYRCFEHTPRTRIQRVHFAETNHTFRSPRLKIDTLPFLTCFTIGTLQQLAYLTIQHIDIITFNKPLVLRLWKIAINRRNFFKCSRSPGLAARRRSRSNSVVWMALCDPVVRDDKLLKLLQYRANSRMRLPTLYAVYSFLNPNQLAMLLSDQQHLH